jgi:isochorismate synthase/2-succinyl-5-enolpyruvyl-6-hydroxy-3-cyclohexene-1-carboxylate synthase/2-succinyl-6-hydroxy-2,4-cyclohexadiene-1-carboxylate synthase/O-succinylbenzoate synthase
MAILNLLASQRKCRLSEILAGSTSNPLLRDQGLVVYNQNSSAHIKICALLDSNGTPMEVALAVAKLVDEGFTTVKLKVILLLVYSR